MPDTMFTRLTEALNDMVATITSMMASASNVWEGVVGKKRE